jgi:hypothetical protein
MTRRADLDAAPTDAFPFCGYARESGEALAKGGEGDAAPRLKHLGRQADVSPGWRWANHPVSKITGYDDVGGSS